MSRHEVVTCDLCGCTLPFEEWVHLPFRSRMVVSGKFWYYDLCGKTCTSEFEQWVQWASKTIIAREVMSHDIFIPKNLASWG